VQKICYIYFGLKSKIRSQKLIAVLKLTDNLQKSYFFTYQYRNRYNINLHYCRFRYRYRYPLCKLRFRYQLEEWLKRQCNVIFDPYYFFPSITPRPALTPYLFFYFCFEFAEIFACKLWSSAKRHGAGPNFFIRYGTCSPLVLILFGGTGKYCVRNSPMNNFFIGCSFNECCMAQNFGLLVHNYAILSQHYATQRRTILLKFCMLIQLCGIMTM
jgi:hypothetical protein